MQEARSLPSVQREARREVLRASLLCKARESAVLALWVYAPEATADILSVRPEPA